MKELTSDSKYSNRHLWNAFWTAGKTLIKRDADNERRIYKTVNIWKTLCIGMDPVSPILCDCISVPMDCVLYKSQFRLPKILESSYGWIYRLISSPDNSRQVVLVTPNEFQIKVQIRHNKELYAFGHDGYLWSNAPFPKVLFSTLPEGNYKHFQCTDESDNTIGTGNCGSLLDLDSGIPDYLEDSAIKMALQELGVFINRPTDNVSNNSESQREQSI